MAQINPNQIESAGLAEALENIHRTFQHFLDQGLADNVADLDSELTVPRARMRSEGIS